MNNNTCWLTIICSAIATVASIAITAIVVDGYRDCQYIKAGYTRKTLPGSSYPQWVKESPGDCSKNAQVPGLDPRNWTVSEPMPLSGVQK